MPRRERPRDTTTPVVTDDVDRTVRRHRVGHRGHVGDQLTDRVVTTAPRRGPGDLHGPSILTAR
ncbi:MAG: hypothetical protein ABS81_22950 [Pseudonocardia sp. SCN 72-86]|nr:MAG: hypothetical protein ABS81_22950 [Pseudonocardia sp. SCN 72-86]